MNTPNFFNPDLYGRRHSVATIQQPLGVIPAHQVTEGFIHHRASLPNIFSPIVPSSSQSFHAPQLTWKQSSRRNSRNHYQDIASTKSSSSSSSPPLLLEFVDNDSEDANSNSSSLPAEDDYPIITDADLEAAKKDPNAIPRRQKLRFDGDVYTPKWVRYTGQLKEGYCDSCQPGKWLQLKNSAYWYHKQFYHGISSVSGRQFVEPLECRPADHDVIEGLCHQCHQFVAICNSKRKNSVLWYRHAHKCHIYDKPKTKTMKRSASATPTTHSKRTRQ
ncbi:hypothetical protein EC973_008689 [Apophysomyces ossiformis]|uniref:Transcription regulator Rua1 C-terminal domain-containing protein n=1 Tax=Apophysomyces ossiformis TaxID=679940 RepID=A0A8H7ETF0_9FUNG|nr:hypothetical protein EC973_008689 [Apophysomyces ossiformis]